MSAKEQVKKEIIEAYVFLRTNNMTIPRETLEFMKDSSLKALDQALTIPVVSKCYTEKDMDGAYDKGFNDGNQRDLTGSLIEVL
jgi:hypothetical protein